MTNEIKLGDFIKGQYKYGCIQGIVVKINKSAVVIKKCNEYYDKYTLTETLVNVTKSRINRIGLESGESII